RQSCRISSYWGAFCSPPRQLILALFLAILGSARQLFLDILPCLKQLSRHLKYPYDEYLRSDILSDLGRRYNDHPAYQVYIELLYNNQDPMETDEWCDHIYRLAHGHNDSEY
ncbi:hypothetical protein, partial [Acetobacterium sp.]|uniref:hypothetical protein n=1 Tax=Acetobacterium sp. TaxID=1872094 RepID=UPI0027236B06